MGGGIAGLWTLARLRAMGYRCLLMEQLALGAGQTIASQGIIHGGVKYALGSGGATDASKAIAQMPGVWRACLEGHGEVDLRAAKVLSESQYLWTAPGLSGMLGGLGATLAMRADCRSVDGVRRPAVLRGAPRSVNVYEVDEPVLDARSVVEAIAKEQGAWCVRPRGIKRLGCSHRADGAVESIWVHGPGDTGEGSVFPKAVVCVAGEGNAALRSITGSGGRGALPDKPQVRPLHMVMVRGAPGPMFAHCVGASTLPKLTITSAPDERGLGGWVWYVGGAIAEPESGAIERNELAQISATLRVMHDVLGWVDVSGCELATCRWNRAEGVPSGQTRVARPEGPTISRAEGGNVMYAWPTKLAFAPLLAERVSEQLSAMGVMPSGAGVVEAPSVFEPAPIAPRPWEGRMVVSKDGFPTIQEVTWNTARSATLD